MTQKFLTDKEEIKAYLDSFYISRYEIVDSPEFGAVVNVFQAVNLKKSTPISECLVKFGTVDGHFLCDNQNLTNLDWAPHTVVGRFICKDNLLTSLKGSPSKIIVDFDCSGNQLINLIGGPVDVGHSYSVSQPSLESLEGCPDIIYGHFSCSGENKLKDLTGGPKKVLQSFTCSGSGITSLKGSPLFVGGNFDASYNRLGNLEGCPEELGDCMYVIDCQLNSMEWLPKKLSGYISCDKNPALGPMNGVSDFALQVSNSEHLREQRKTANLEKGNLITLLGQSSMDTLSPPTKEYKI